jgi:hypothetical protein
MHQKQPPAKTAVFAFVGLGSAACTLKQARAKNALKIFFSI